MEQEIITQILQHISILNDEYGQMAQLVAILQTDVAWLKQFFWVMFTAVSATLVGTFWNLIVLRRNGKNKK